MNGDRWNPIRRGNDSLYSALNKGSGMRREIILTALAECPNGLEQTLITVLNQVQDVDVIIKVPLGDRHN